MEGYFERVVEALVGAGYRWYETANFCRPGREAQHNLGYRLGHDYLGVGIGVVSTVGADRWRNAPSLARYVGALAAGVAPPRETEELDATTKLTERLMLGLRLDRPLAFADVSAAVELDALERLEALGLAERRDGGLQLTERGRFLGGAVTAELMAAEPVERLPFVHGRGRTSPDSQPSPGGDPRARRRGLRRHGRTRRLEDACRACRRRGVPLHGEKRARGARGARSPVPPAHVRRACSDGHGLPRRRRSRPGAARAEAGVGAATEPPGGAEPRRRGAPRDHGRACAGHAPARARVRAAARDDQRPPRRGDPAPAAARDGRGDRRPPVGSPSGSSPSPSRSIPASPNGRTCT